MSRWRYNGDNERDDNYFSREKMLRKPGAMKPGSALTKEFELPEAKWAKLLKPDFFAARVVEVHKGYAFVSTEREVGQIDTRDVWLGTIARKYMVAKRVERNLVCVGDRVLCRVAKDDEVPQNDAGDLPKCVILHATPRATKISRLDPIDENRRHVLASNVDQLVVVASYKFPLIKWGLIDRYLVLAESERIPPIIVLNKKDLLDPNAEPDFCRESEERRKLFENIGYKVFQIQASEPGAERDPAVREFKELLKNKISLVTGHSGVGKSTLVNLFNPEIVQSVEPNSDIFYKGRHTTSYASLIKLGTGGYVIDTPGIRSFVLEDLSAIELTDCFLEFRPFLGKCEYRECSHIEEPGCAVLAALERGEISESRYRSYTGILLRTTGREGRMRDVED